MIYERVEPGSPIRQGDIVLSVPRLDVSFSRLPILQSDESCEEISWKEHLVPGTVGRSAPVDAIVSVRGVPAIVLTQDCDAIRSPEIALAELFNFPEVEGRFKSANTPKGKMSIITQHARINAKWFYLPVDKDLGFDQPLGVDFRQVLRLSREDLEGMCPSHRRARLNDVALAHFRERLSEFYRRYPYDEWYPLDREELDAYQKSKTEPVEPYPWQK